MLTMFAEPPPLPIQIEPLPYEALLEARAASAIEMIVIHCTETPDLSSARQIGEKVQYASGTGNSGHFYIDRDGEIYQYIDPLRVAHHTRGYNQHSIGIELINTGRYPNWYDSRHQAMNEAYTDTQINSLIALLAKLKITYSSLQKIAGHEDLDTARVAASDDPSKTVARKRDPGPLFPWNSVLEQIALKRIHADD